MLQGAYGISKSNALLHEYSSLMAEAVLRERTRVAEHTARIESELASKVKSEFISNMSHELRTPLNTVIGFSKILANQQSGAMDAEQVIEYANLINDAAAHLLTVINDILDISKIQAGSYTLDARELDVKEILSRQIEAISNDAAAAQVAIENLLPEALPPIRGDDGKLAQIFGNLLSNAVKFTLPGGKVEIESRSSQDESLTIIIRDTGVGMTPEELAIALEPFGQVDGSRTRWREGTGLGLPIAKSLTELHGGTLNIRSEKDAGTEAVLHFPSRNYLSIAAARDAVFGGGGKAGGSR